ncbi:MAG: hypothetical protein DRO15_01050 [Thermoprotei archaeon]|nr:MAG: hypothetical protein DRO15_01050 [Thermoprotei archaeon]
MTYVDNIEIAYILMPIVLLILNSLIALKFKERTWILGSISTCASMFMIHNSVIVLSTSKILDLELFSITLGNIYVTFKFVMDSLSALFTLILGVVGFAVSIYGISYITHCYKHEDPRLYWIYFSILLASMYMVFNASDVILMVFFWDVASILTAFLISYDRNNIKARKAAKKFLVMSLIGSALILLAFLALAFEVGSLSFYDMREALSKNTILKHPMMYLIESVMFVGFGIKAALVPLHTWLPRAHPEAPSSISALLSGITVNIGIYGFVRAFFLVLQPSMLWAIIFILNGFITLLIGSTLALAQNDAKRLIAYSTMGHIGYVMVGLGGSAYLLSKNIYEFTVLGSILLISSLLYLLSHSLFKTVLFLSAGNVISRIGTRNLMKMGGLARGMPITFIASLLAVLSMIGIPPFIGFIAKSLMHISILASGTTLLADVAIGILATIITASYGIKYLASVFLGKQRDLKIIKRDVEGEAPSTMLVPLVFLTSTCIIMGLYPRPIIELLISIASSVTGLGAPDILQYLFIYPSLVLIRPLPELPLGIYLETVIISLLLLASPFALLISYWIWSHVELASYKVLFFIERKIWGLIIEPIRYRVAYISDTYEKIQSSHKFMTLLTVAIMVLLIVLIIFS